MLMFMLFSAPGKLVYFFEGSKKSLQLPTYVTKYMLISKGK